MPGRVPSTAGRTVVVANHAIRVELLPDIGARLHRLRVFGHDLLRTPDDPSTHVDDPFGWGAYVMAPWCNRIEAAPTAIEGQSVDVPSNFPDGTAIHGQVYDERWQQLDDDTLRVEGGGGGWPWRYECAMHVAVIETTLTIEQTLTNLAETTMPGGLGLHPWFRRPVEVRVNAGSALRSNLDPQAMAVPVSGRWDLRAMRPMPHDLDAAWLILGDPAVELRWPAADLQAAMRVRSGAGAWIVAASPGSVDAVAIEPQTHAPHGLRRFMSGEPGGLHSLEPGDTLELTTELAFERP